MKLLNAQVYLIASILTLFFVSACSTLPDMDRAQNYLARGDLAAAQKELLELSAVGLPVAKLRLADLYLQMGSEAADRLAEDLYVEILASEPQALSRLAKLYRKRVANGQQEYFAKAVALYLESAANKQTDALAGLTELYLSNPQNIDAHVPLQQWIDARLAEGDVSARFDLARLYLLQGDVVGRRNEILDLCKPIILEMPGCFNVLAEVYSAINDTDSLAQLVEDLLAAYDNQQVTAYFTYRFAKNLTADGIGDVELAIKIFSEVAEAYPDAYMSMARLIVKNGKTSSKEELLSLLHRRAQAGEKEAHYLLGRLYFKGEWVAQNPQLAEFHLKLASEENVGAGLMLGVIYKEGWLGEPDFDLALEYLLAAARNGSASADRELAEMFWFARGVKQNAVYAYVFARLAKQGSDVKGANLLAQIDASADIELRLQGEKLCQQEIQIRSKMLSAKLEALRAASNSQLVVQ